MRVLPLIFARDRLLAANLNFGRQKWTDGQTSCLKAVGPRIWDGGGLTSGHKWI